MGTPIAMDVLHSASALLAADDGNTPAAAAFFGFMGCASALVFACLGAAYGTAKSGVVVAGVIGIYGLIIAVILATNVTPTAYTAFRGFAHLASGLSVGLSGLAAGMAIGIVGDAGVRATAQQPRLFTGMILILIFAEALGLYGLIVALILSTK